MYIDSMFCLLVFEMGGGIGLIALFLQSPGLQNSTSTIHSVAHSWLNYDFWALEHPVHLLPDFLGELILMDDHLFCDFCFSQVASLFYCLSFSGEGLGVWVSAYLPYDCFSPFLMYPTLVSGSLCVLYLPTVFCANLVLPYN